MDKGLCTTEHGLQPQDLDETITTVTACAGPKSKGLHKIRALVATLRSSFARVASIRIKTKSGRRRLTEVNQTPCRSPTTPQTRCRMVLGRTPAKLYSPFGIETPCADIKPDSAYNPDTPEHDFSPKKKRGKYSQRPWNVVARRPRALFH